MYKNDSGEIMLSASDLANHLACGHLTALARKAVMDGVNPPYRADAFLDTLRKRGEKFEAAHLKSLIKEGLKVVQIDRDDRNARVHTVEAMKKGADVIYQARLSSGRFAGWADFLIRTDVPGKLGKYSYEVVDTKLANETRAGTMLQIVLYSEIIAEIQGMMPEHMHVRTPDENRSYRVEDYIHYTRYVKTRLMDFIGKPPETYPEPVAHCQICNWFSVCEARRREDDHLGYVAGMGTSQMREVRSHGLETMQDLAKWKMKPDFKPSSGNWNTYARLKKQAELQVEFRDTQRKTVHFIEQTEPGKGFGLIPKPAGNDIFLDFEGDPLVEPKGREYLLGYVHKGKYTALWGLTPEDEKAALEKFIDFVSALFKKDKNAHIYHFGAYEEVALKRLATRYNTRQEPLDNLLREQRLVNLHQVVRHAVQVGVERYSLKDLEKFHGFLREADLRALSPHKIALERFIQEGREEEIPAEAKEMVRQYNEDDCRSTEALQKWLEKIRPKGVPRNPEPKEKTPTPEQLQAIAEAKAQYDALMKGIPEDPKDRSEDQHARYLLAGFLGWYKREENVGWWESFRLLSCSDDELLDETVALSGLRYTGKRRMDGKLAVDAYFFPSQDHDLRSGKDVYIPNPENADRVAKFGEIVGFDEGKSLVYIKKPQKMTDIHPSSVFHHKVFVAFAKKAAIRRLATWVLAKGKSALTAKGSEWLCGRSLLLRSNPRFRKLSLTSKKKLTLAELALDLEPGSNLPIQGPPGSGKSTKAAEMVLELIRKKKKVGATALSHKVITELLGKIYHAAKAAKLKVSMLQRVDEADDGIQWTQYTSADKSKFSDAFEDAQVIGGTPHMWASEEYTGSLDYLIVDEAGQLSLVDTVACSEAARNLILLGDPRQLQQPQQGSHPDGTEVSALEHILNGNQTIRDEQGVFLDLTYRMHPKICSFVSGSFYEGKLQPAVGMNLQEVIGPTRFAGHGLVYVPVEHAGRSISSPEEKDVVLRIVRELISGKNKWTNDEGKKSTLTASNIKIIAPFNSQVNSIQDDIEGIAVGTVDKFQGQQAEVMIFSVASSSAEDTPRGMGFLYAHDRLNVAVSRAKALFILVASPLIFEVNCKTPEQIRLANPWSRFRSVAREVRI